MNPLIITDDSPRDRLFLADVLEKYSPIRTANGDEALRAISGLVEPWVVTDIQMPGFSGIELAKKIWSKQSTARVLFWSQHSDETYVRALARLIPAETVYGYVLKNNPADVLLRAADAVFLDYQCWIDPLIRSVQARANHKHDVLTDAEFAVLVDISLGLTDNTIAERRYLSRRGVQNRLQSLYSKLGANLDIFSNPRETELLNMRSRAVSIALQRGLINAFELKEEEKLLLQWFKKRK